MQSCQYAEVIWQRGRNLEVITKLLQQTDKLRGKNASNFSWVIKTKLQTEVRSHDVPSFNLLVKDKLFPY